MTAKETKAFGLLLFAWSFMLLGCPQNSGPKAEYIHELKESSMEHQFEERPSSNIPPIDAAVSGQFQTASFGLG
jgi:hypothetical protein